MTNPNPDPKPNYEENRQPPEDVLNRLSGVPRTPEEQAADIEQHQQEANRQAQRTAGTAPNQPNQPTQPTPQPRVETERQQRDKT